MGAECLPEGVRAVLSAPRGRRFTRTRAGTTGAARTRSPTRSRQKQQQQLLLLAQMADNPRVSYRQAHGQLPAWMHIQAARLAARYHQRAAQTPEEQEPREPVVPDRSPAPLVPRPRPAPDDGPLPPPPVPGKPPLPRRPRRPRPHDGRISGAEFGAETDPGDTATRTGASHPRHRRPRRRTLPGPLWLLAAYTLASAAAALAHYLCAARI